MLDYYPLTDAQKTIMSASNITMKSNKLAESNVILDFYFQVMTNCNFAVLESAYQYLMENNDSLRLFFLKKGFNTVQYIKPWDRSKPEEVVLHNQSEFEDFYKNLSQYALPVINHNPIRCFLVKVNDSGALVFRAHHLLLDGYSEELILGQLENYYTNAIEGKVINKKPVSIKRYFENVEKYHKNRINKDRKYWKKIHWHQRNYHSVVPWRGSQESLTSEYEIDDRRLKKIYEMLHDLSKNTMMSMQSLMSYLLGLAIFRLSGVDNFAITNVSHGRRNYLLKQCVGCMMESIPVYFDFNEEDTIIANFLKYNKEYYENMAHGQLPLKDHLVMIAPNAIKDRFNFQHFWWLDFSFMGTLDDLQRDRYRINIKESNYMGFPFYVGMYEKTETSIIFRIEHQKYRFPIEKIDDYWRVFLDTIDLFIEKKEENIKFLNLKK